MKILSRSTLRLAGLLAAATLLLAPAVRAQDDASAGATARVKFSDPTKPGTLRLILPWAEARITGTDGPEVVVTSSLDQKGRAEVDSDGFRRLDEDVTFELIEKDNIASISIAGDNLWATHGAEFEIQVPRNTNLVIRTEIGGDLDVEGVEGDLDISCMNGEVNLTDIASSAVVNSMNGEIRASFKHAPVKAVSLSSMNGEIDVHLPGDTKANLRMRTHNGSIRTNFPAGVLETKTEKVSGRTSIVADSREGQRELQRELAKLGREQAEFAREAARAAVEEARQAMEVAVETRVETGVRAVAPAAPAPPVPPMPNFGGKSIVGTLNGGGVDIKLTSMNGTITLRAAK
jgi:Putative adhesin